MLISEVIDVAQHSGLQRLEAEFNGERTASMHCFLTAGFREMLRMKGYLKSMAGGSHDWVLLGINLMPSVECMGAGD
jgi:L-amino acid N-acyltransferase YncA